MLNSVAIIVPVSRWHPCVEACIESCLAEMKDKDVLIIVYDSHFNHMSYKCPSAQFSADLAIRLREDSRVCQVNLLSSTFGSVFGNAQRDYATQFLPEYFYGFRIFVDDDDVLLPGALEVLRNLPQSAVYTLQGFGVRSFHGHRFFGSTAPGECTGSQFAWPMGIRAKWMKTNRCASDYDTLQEILKTNSLVWHDLDIVLTKPHEALVV